MGTVHQLLEAHGKQAALQLDLDRRVIEAARDYMSDEEGGVGFIYSCFVQRHCRTSGSLTTLCGKFRLSA